MGELFYTKLDPLFVEDVMRMMMEDDDPIAPTLKRAWFLPKYKLMINIIHRFFYGLLGSFNQVSVNQQMLLAGLTSDIEINWESWRTRKFS